MAQFQILDQLMNLAGSSNLHDRMRVWFVQQAMEDSAFANLLFVCCQHLRRVMNKHRIMMVDMEALGDRGVAVDSLEALRKSYNRQKSMLEIMTDLLAQARSGVREEEGNAVKMNENN
ncbi:hypothetical protein CTI12_AA370010 [Artemisia annua]|uniref:Uncharacterized protein n=1 Tax=Artemisia annua TaxID=35608 RepID=A0A2U1M2D3_ARTAN|nr:hypothetical protein CTI12_AA425660 [Artemisia annua]PWA61776.1 hypothetical protein CTI12_AA370010 [Artemisia annua]